MKLLIIVLSLLSERYLIHSVSFIRFQWFEHYRSLVLKQLPKNEFVQNPYVLLFLIIVPILLPVALVNYLFSSLFFGFFGLLIELIIFYYCLGPANPFYPVTAAPIDDVDAELIASQYLARVNNELFAVIFWFLVLGPIGVLFYRLVSLLRDFAPTALAAEVIVGLLDWVTVRITFLLYLLVGNFQQGFQYYTKMFLSHWRNNLLILSTGGLLAARTHEQDSVTLSYAQNLVDHALIIYLVCIALFTIVAWL